MRGSDVEQARARVTAWWRLPLRGARPLSRREGRPYAGPAHPTATTGGRGCHLNRPIDRLVTASGLEVTRLETYYMKAPRAMQYTFEGVAVKP